MFKPLRCSPLTHLDLRSAHLEFIHTNFLTSYILLGDRTLHRIHLHRIRVSPKEVRRHLLLQDHIHMKIRLMTLHTRHRLHHYSHHLPNSVIQPLLTQNLRSNNKMPHFTKATQRYQESFNTTRMLQREKLPTTYQTISMIQNEASWTGR